MLGKNEGRGERWREKGRERRKELSSVWAKAVGAASHRKQHTRAVGWSATSWLCDLEQDISPP